MSRRIVFLVFMAAFLVTVSNVLAAEGDEPQGGRRAGDRMGMMASPERMAALLERFPEADTDGDGVLSREEARAYMVKRMEERGGAFGGAGRVRATKVNEKYGTDERNVLDFWVAESEKATPVLVFIHGGDFVGGSKSQVMLYNQLIDTCLKNGVSFAAINYRYAKGDDVKDSLSDCGRAVQFIRSKAGDWNVDKKRIAVFGGGSGADMAMWLGFVDDLANADSSDAVGKESSRVVAVGAMENGDFRGMRANAGRDEAEDRDAKVATVELAKLISKGDSAVFFSELSENQVTEDGRKLGYRAIKRRCDKAGIKTATAEVDVKADEAGDRADRRGGRNGQGGPGGPGGPGGQGGQRVPDDAMGRMQDIQAKMIEFLFDEMNVDYKVKMEIRERGMDRMQGGSDMGGAGQGMGPGQGGQRGQGQGRNRN